MSTSTDGSRVLTYAVELTVAVLLGMIFFALFIAGLNATFPDATGLGEIVRNRGSRAGLQTGLNLGEAESAAVATLSNVLRDVRHKPSSSVIWSSAERGRDLGDRHAVQSHAGSGATITFDEKNQIELGENTIIVVRKPRRVDARKRRAAVLFMDGFMRGHLGGSADGPLELEVLTAGGAVRAAEGSEEGAEIALSVDRESSSLAVHEGAVELVWGEDEEARAIPAGHMISFSEGQVPGEPVALPVPPSRLRPRENATFRYRATPPTIGFDWRPEDDAKVFRVQIARDAGFRQIVYQGDLSETSFEHGTLSEGKYHWRVAALRGPVASAPGSSGTFNVERLREPPALDVSFPDAPVASDRHLLTGRTDPGCGVIIAETEVPVDSEGRFEFELELRAGYNFVVVQAVDAYGNTAFKNHTIIAEPRQIEREP